ncbi:MAG: hypothetical protein JW966_00860 [Anaerolineae bacterium]|nr:hypothetical protein [Anaerolineae bacterium]
MILKKYPRYLFVCLTFIVLAACEPLAPEQTPQYIVVTGETPISASSAALAASPDGPALTAEPPAAVGAVNTPVPSPTPIPPPTGTPSPTPYVCAETSGRLLNLSLRSAVTGDEFLYDLYLPPCFFDTFQRYPYVVLLHGTGYDHTMWQELDALALLDQGIRDGTLPPMVLVMPDGSELAELNDQPDGASYETMILDELLPTIESDFCLWGGRRGRAIGGISRGGFWAFSMAFRHADMFSAVGGHSPHFDPEHAFPENNPLDLAEQTNLAKFPLRIYIDHAAEDYVGTYAAVMSDILYQHGVEHDYLINPTGDHDMDYWSVHTLEYLSFYGEQWPRDVTELPSCLEPSPSD